MNLKSINVLSIILIVTFIAGIKIQAMQSLPRKKFELRPIDVEFLNVLDERPFDMEKALSLLDKGADPNLKDSIFQFYHTILHRAIMHGYDDVILAKILAIPFLQVDIQDADGNTPLHLAIQKENIPLIKELLRLNATVKKANKKGETPLHLAVSINNQELVSKFLKLGADINAQTIHGRRPIHYTNDIGMKWLLSSNGAQDIPDPLEISEDEKEERQSPLVEWERPVQWGE